MVGPRRFFMEWGPRPLTFGRVRMAAPTSAFIASESRYAASVGAPGTLLINNSPYAARIYTERGMAFQLEGGNQQSLTLNAIVLCSLLAAAHLIDAEGKTRSILVTHVESGLVYRIDTGGVNRSPYGVYWELNCSEPTAE